MTANNKRILYSIVTFGCDPELFLSSSGKIIGSERVIPDAGIYGDPANIHSSKAIQDGVQVEINPGPSTCRQSLAGNISLIFRQLKKRLDAQNVDASFEAVVTIDKEELDQLNEKARKLGCQPSLNFYDAKATIKVDPETYLKRSAGGHIHVGLSNAHIFRMRKNIIPMMDIFVGNTCVLIDRDPNAAERRQIYGRAGEFRLPKHGLEYRTLSNFWLRSYQLMSLVMGLTRLAVSVVGTNVKEIHTPVSHGGFGDPWDAEKEILDRVNLEDIREAINNNDLDLAMKNFERVKEFIAEYVLPMGTGIDKTNLAQFEYFAKKVQEKGLSYWFPLDPVSHWSGLNTNTGAERFLNLSVTSKMDENHRMGVTL